MRGLVLLLAIAACGDGSHGTPDAGSPDAPSPDAPSYPACHEFQTTPTAVPAHVAGALAGADLQSPSQCDVVDAPYGIESAGPDSVVALTGLVPGTAYVVNLESTSDLAFYVVTGCSTPSGPAVTECALFEDASTGNEEVGRFVAAASTAYVVVDYYASHVPTDASFVLDVYAEACTDNAGCSAGLPVCANGRCVECATSFDCTDPTKPRCDVAQHACAAGVDQCLTDDTGEPANDGPAGATLLVPDANGDAVASGLVCAAPQTEADYLAFDVGALGETWDLALAWNGARDLDLEVFDAHGTVVGLSYWEQPEHVRLTYLPLGRYYLRVTEFVSSPDAAPVGYTVSAHRASGAGCVSNADCASEFRNQIYRGDCVAGACVALEGMGAVTEGGACDSASDCGAGLACPSFYFVADADTREVCARGCSTDAECAPLGTDYVCTTYLNANFCVQKCTQAVECPTAIGTAPTVPPWYRLSCDVASGHCLP